MRGIPSCISIIKSADPEIFFVEFVERRSLLVHFLRVYPYGQMLSIASLGQSVGWASRCNLVRAGAAFEEIPQPDTMMIPSMTHLSRAFDTVRVPLLSSDMLYKVHI